MKSFEDFFKELTSDEQWFELSLMHHKPETFRSVAFKVYVNACADKDTFSVTPIREHRKHVYNKLVLLPGDKVKKDWVQIENEKLKKQEEEKKKKEWVPLTGEAREKKLQEWLDKVRSVEMQTAVPRITHKEAIEKGDWLPPKGPTYPTTTAMEAYNKERKIAYYRYCFDPITRDKLPTWMEEEVYNAEFDRIMVKEKKHPHWETLQEI